MDPRIEASYQRSIRNIQELEVLKNGLEGHKMVQNYLKTLEKLEKAKIDHHECSKQYHLTKMSACEHLFVTSAKEEEEEIRKVCLKCGFDTGMIAKKSEHPAVEAMQEYVKGHQIGKGYTIYRVHHLEKIKKLYQDAKPKQLSEDAMALLLQELVDQQS